MDQSALGDLLKWARDQLMSSTDTPGLDARVLLQHIAKRSHAELISHDSDVLPVNEAEIFRELIRKRRQGTPVAYLTGEREFWSKVFKVTTATLIPRPETELLVEQTLIHIPKNKTFTVADIGTGCGAIALAVALERPAITLIATDISEEALTVARWNGDRFGIRNVEYRCGHMISPLEDKCCNIIVSNPPYIREDDPHLRKGDVAFEPGSALISGTDGLDAIRMIASDAPHKLKARGWLVIEHGYDQARQVRAILEHEAFASIETRCDLSGHERVTQGQLA